MIRTIFIIALLFGFSFVTNSQVKFQTLSFEEGLAQAEQQHKMIFIDVFAVWCGPCKMLDRDVFPNKELGNYLNAHFINLKIDGDKPENREIREFFEVDAYPTLLFIDPVSGNIRKIRGFADANEVLKEAKYLVNPATTPTAQAREKFHASQDKADLKNWIARALEDNGDTSDDLEQAFELFTQNYPEIDFEDEIEMIIFLSNDNEISDPNVVRYIAQMHKFDPELNQYVFINLLESHLLEAMLANDFTLLEKFIADAYHQFEPYLDENMSVEVLLAELKNYFDSPELE
jgi:thioredoxin-related protein